MALFAVELVYGDDREARLAVRPKHREYLRGLAADGIVRVAGPWADDTGALIVYQVADQDELRDVLAADPYTAAQVVASTTIREWNPVTGAGLTLGD